MHKHVLSVNLWQISFGPVPDFKPVIFSQLDGDVVPLAALRSLGAPGSSGVDAAGWKRMRCSLEQSQPHSHGELRLALPRCSWPSPKPFARAGYVNQGWFPCIARWHRSIECLIRAVLLRCWKGLHYQANPHVHQQHVFWATTFRSGLPQPLSRQMASRKRKPTYI